MLDRFLSMQLFVAVVEGGSLTAAAERFALSRPMVGKHMAALEERLGTRLLVRTTRRQHLTEAGQQFYQRCRAILAEVQEAEEETRGFGGEVRGLVRINAPVTFGSLRLAALLPGFMERHPAVRVELTVSDQLADLVEEGFDVLVRIGPIHDETLVARPLEPYRMVLAASPAYLARHGSPATPDDLADHLCLGLSSWAGGRGWALGGEDRFGSASFVSNNGQALKAMALAGGGIILQPRILLDDALEDGRLVEVLAGQGPEPRPVNLLYRRDRLGSAKLAALVSYLQEQLRG